MQNVGSSDIYDSDIIDVMWWTDSGCVCVGGHRWRAKNKEKNWKGKGGKGGRGKKRRV